MRAIELSIHGYETQIEEYSKAKNTLNMIYLLVNVGNPKRVKMFIDSYNSDIDERKIVPKAIVIDSTNKESASIT